MPMKSCSKCRELKALSEFDKDKSKADGLFSSCKACKAKQNKSFREKYPRKHAEYKATWQRENREKCAATSLRYQERYPERVKQSRERLKEWQREYRKEWRKKNAMRIASINDVWKANNKERLKKYKADYYKRHPGQAAIEVARRRASKKRAMPAWANPKYIKLFYKLAKEDSLKTGLQIEVDHIVPLQSPTVCGLHVEDNLQLLPRTKNAKKGNRIWPDMWEPT